MASFRFKDNGVVAALVRKMEGKRVIFSQERAFKGPKAEALARDWARRMEASIEAYGVPARRPKAGTLGALLRTHREALDKAHRLNRGKRTELLRLEDEFDKLPLDGMRAVVFSKYAQRRRAEGVNGSTVLKNLSTIRTLLGIAKPIYGIEVDASAIKESLSALTRMRVVDKGTPRTRRPSAAELAQLVASFKAETALRLDVEMDKVILLAIEFPRRVSELCAMRWDDYADNAIWLRDTKNPTAPRTEHVPVLPAAATIINSLPRSDERILPYVAESLTAIFRRHCDRLGIDDLHFHDFRREGISRLFRAGYSIPEVAKISGHLDWNMLQIYTELRPQDVLEKFS